MNKTNLATELRDLRLEIRQAVANLPRSERQVIELRFGFDEQPMTLAEIAMELGLDVSMVRMIEHCALTRLTSMRP